VAGERAYEEKFSEYGDDVDGAFLYLLNKLEALWSEADFNSLRKICIRDIILSESLRNSLHNACTLEKTFNFAEKFTLFNMV